MRQWTVTYREACTGVGRIPIQNPNRKFPTTVKPFNKISERVCLRRSQNNKSSQHSFQNEFDRSQKHFPGGSLVPRPKD